ncbi:MAG TPA: outer membrane lipoprotein-sorting protein, partial [Spirochaetia bacterium]|nr:outer membrane lipoprotein-sorting protein [Spirochaetia bacterium]
DYTFSYTTVDNPEAGLLYLKCVPKPGKPIVWGYIITAVQADSLIPVRQEFFDEKGSLMRTMYYRDIKTFGGRRVPSVMELVPEHKAGQKTVLTYQELSFNISIQPDLFSLRNLRRF